MNGRTSISFLMYFFLQRLFSCKTLYLTNVFQLQNLIIKFDNKFQSIKKCFKLSNFFLDIFVFLFVNFITNEYLFFIRKIK